MALSDAVTIGGCTSTIGGCADHARRLLPRAEADMLLCHALDVPRSHVHAFPERNVGTAEAERLAQWVARRHGGEPVAYILGERGFWGLDLTVTPDVLIPRPDTETLVAAALPRIRADARVHDLGTGSGAIALAIAMERPEAQIVASDIDPLCVALCRHNAERLGLHVEALLADLFNDIPGRFDVVVSNPPYVANDDDHLQRGDLRFEPPRALRGGANGGTDVIAALVREAPHHLESGGWLCVEHGYDQELAVRRLFLASGFADIRNHRDLADHPRVTTGRLP